jgi:hypothetical protein
MKVLSGFGTGAVGRILEEITNCLFGIALVWFPELSRLGDELSAVGLKLEGNEVLGVSVGSTVMRGLLKLGNTFDG